MSKKRLVYGIGVNDADYTVQPTVNGKLQVCPFYRAWTNMLGRCYSPIEHARRPTYIGCTVVPEWNSFMEFKAWMKDQDWQGKSLDKDIILPGNKVYGPDTCCFVPLAVNSLLNDRASARGRWPQGVAWHKPSQKFQAQIQINGRDKHLGLFSAPEDAHSAYCKAKAFYLREHALLEADDRIRVGLIKHAERFMQTHSLNCLRMSREMWQMQIAA